jgi:hypothetical protein
MNETKSDISQLVSLAIDCRSAVDPEDAEHYASYLYDVCVANYGMTDTRELSLACSAVAEHVIAHDVTA